MSECRVRFDNGCSECFGTGLQHGERCCICKARKSARQRRREIDLGLDQLLQDGTVAASVDTETGEVVYSLTPAGIAEFEHGRDPLACSVAASEECD